MTFSSVMECRGVAMGLCRMEEAKAYVVLPPRWMCVAEGKRAGRCGMLFGVLVLVSMVMCVARVRWLNIL